MSNITEPVDFSDLQQDLISRIRSGGGAADTVIAKRLINTALVNMHLNPGHKFAWAERRGVIITHATYSVGTVSITVASSRTAVTGSGTAWDTAVTGFGFNNVRAGGKIKFSGTSDNYEISSVSSATALSLATTYVGDNLSGVAYTYFEDEYSLATDFLRPVDFRMFSTDLGIGLTGRTDFRRAHVRNDFFQRPKEATIIQLGFSGNTNPRYRVVFYPVPNDEYQIPYWYVTNKLAVTATGIEQERLENNTDEPIIPRGKRQGLTLYALYEFYRDYKDDARAMTVKAEYTEFMGRISGEMDSTDSRPFFYYKGGRRGRRSGGRFDSNGRFDEIIDH